MYYVTCRTKRGKVRLYYGECGWDHWGQGKPEQFWSIDEAKARLDEVKQSYGSIPGWRYPVFEVQYR